MKRRILDDVKIGLSPLIQTIVLTGFCLLAVNLATAYGPTGASQD